MYTDSMIGNETLAQTINSIPWHLRENEDSDIALDSLGDIPEGWEYIGSGAYRHCFRGPDGNVYKVLTYFALDDSWDSNREQYEGYTDLCKIAQDAVGVAACSLFLDGDVLAQEYVEGRYSDRDMDPQYYSFADSIMRLCKVLGWQIDVHSGNFVVVNDKPVLIDW